MLAENILVIAVDGLRAAALGAYGNTAYATPALDQLAAESLVFDWCYADAVELPPVYRSLWQAEPSLLRSLRERGYMTTLVTDDPAVPSYAGAVDFHDCTQWSPGEIARAEDVSQTALARLFAATCEQLESTATTAPRLIWVHSRGLYGSWDAPLALQEPLLEREEGDPEPADAIEPPDLWPDEASDPDATFRWSCAYTTQVMVLDACLDALRQTLDDPAQQGRWLVVFCGLRGFPLGEHGRVGGVDGRLFAEQLHVPMLWRFPDGARRLARSSQLLSPADISPLLLGWLDGGFKVPKRDALTSVGPAGERSLRTAEWSLRSEPSTTAEDRGCELFVRPDDRWEANDVATLCPDVVEQLLAHLQLPPAR